MDGIRFMVYGYPLPTALYTASEKVWALPNLFTRVYTRLEVVTQNASRTRKKGWVLDYRNLIFNINQSLDSDDKK